MDEEVQTKSVLRSDGQGRVTAPREKREAIVDEFERSGLKMAPFARQAGIKYASLAAWVGQRRHQRAKHKGQAKSAGRARTPMRLMEAVLAVGHVPEAQALRLLLPCGASLVIANGRHAALAAELLKALRTPC